MTLVQIREALSEAAGGITGLTATAYVTDQIVGPQVTVARQQIDYNVNVGGGTKHTYNFVVSVYVARTMFEAWQAFLDELAEYTGATSMRAALEADDVATAAGADYVWVKSAAPITERTVGAVTYLIEDFEIEVVA
jgi:hypothetical protein